MEGTQEGEAQARVNTALAIGVEGGESLRMLVRSGMLYDVNKLSREERVKVVAALVEGNSIRATVRMTGIAKNTVAKLLAELGCAWRRVQRGARPGVKAKRVECDEFWSFVGAKQKNASAKKRLNGWGDVWTWTALDAESKLIVS